MKWTRPLSISLAAACLLLVGWWNGIVQALEVAPILALAVACVWFGETMGKLTNLSWRMMDQTPGWAVRMGGWVLLVVTFAVMVYIRLVKQ